MSGVRTISSGVRRLTIAISFLAVVVGPLLFLLPGQTDSLFSWTIKPPLTAAFLGGAYCTALVIELLAARERIWARARAVYPGMLLFTTLTLIATLIHLDRFHFSSPGAMARFTAWAWLIIYIAAPPLMLALLYLQLRAPGSDPPRRFPLPAWFRALLVVEAVVMMGAGLALFIVPEAANSLWSWALTPLTGRAVGAWLIGLGFAVGTAAWENDWQRVGIAMVGNVVFGGLQLVALVRFTDTVKWASPSAWIYLLLLVGLVALGVYGWYAGRQAVMPGASVQLAAAP